MSKEEFSFLDYLNNYSDENLLIIERQANFKNRDQLALYLGYSKDSIKGWFSKADGRKKIPTIHSWNYVLLQLEARRKGYSSLGELVKSVEHKN